MVAQDPNWNLNNIDDEIQRSNTHLALLDIGATFRRIERNDEIRPREYKILNKWLNKFIEDDKYNPKNYFSSFSNHDHEVIETILSSQVWNRNLNNYQKRSILKSALSKPLSTGSNVSQVLVKIFDEVADIYI
jgi:hypothetical protein